MGEPAAYEGEPVNEVPIIGGQSQQSKKIIVRTSDPDHRHEILIKGSTTRDRALISAGAWTEYFYRELSLQAEVYELVVRSTTTVTEKKIY